MKLKTKPLTRQSSSRKKRAWTGQAAAGHLLGRYAYEK